MIENAAAFQLPVPVPIEIGERRPTQFERRRELVQCIRREIAPYVGLHWERKFGETADFAEERGVDASELAIVVGLHAWF